MRQSVFTARGLTKTYITGEVKVHALAGADLDLFAGELVVLLGPSGSGKSTLLNILGGLDHASAGSVRFGNVNLAELDDAGLTQYRRDHVGFVFQFYNLIPSLTARENVAIVTEVAKSPLTPEAALEVVGRGGRLDHFPAQLSGGEQQRVAIARALATSPTLILADEPTGNLDLATGASVMDLLFTLKEKTGATLLLITHDSELAKRCDRIVSLADGQVVKGGVKRRAAAS